MPEQGSGRRSSSRDSSSSGGKDAHFSFRSRAESGKTWFGALVVLPHEKKKKKEKKARSPFSLTLLLPLKQHLLARALSSFFPIAMSFVMTSLSAALPMRASSRTGECCGSRSAKRTSAGHEAKSRTPHLWPSSPSLSPSITSFSSFSSRLCGANWHPLGSSRVLRDSCRPHGDGAGTTRCCWRENNRARGAFGRVVDRVAIPAGGGGRRRRNQKEIPDVEFDPLESLSRVAEDAFLSCSRN